MEQTEQGRPLAQAQNPNLTVDTAAILPAGQFILIATFFARRCEVTVETVGDWMIQSVALDV